MAKDIRFECKFCHKSVYAPIDAGGRKMKCPHCKNPVAIPVSEFIEDEPPQQKQATAAVPQQKRVTTAIPQQKQATSSVPQQKRATTSVPQQKRESSAPQIPVDPDPGRRAIQVRYRYGFFYQLTRLAIFAAICFFAYKGYLYYKQQNNKSVERLMQEYVDGKILNDILIKEKIVANDYDVLKEHSVSPEEGVRKLVAECIGILAEQQEKIATSGAGFDLLKKYLASDRAVDVRVEAANSLSKVKTIECIDFLVEKIEKEKNPDVDGAIGRALRTLTGETGKSVNKDYWGYWWKANRAQFRFPN